MEIFFSEEQARENLENGFEKARAMLEEPDEIRKMLTTVENELNDMELEEEHLAVMDVFVSIVRSYIDGEYTDIPEDSIVSILSALIYVIVPVDAIPDSIPVVGQLDDIGVAIVCFKSVMEDIEAYRKWEAERRG